MIATLLDSNIPPPKIIKPLFNTFSFNFFMFQVYNVETGVSYND